MSETATPVAVNAVEVQASPEEPLAEQPAEIIEDSFSFAGLMSGVEGEDRALALFEVIRNGQKYEWKRFVPPGTEDLTAFVWSVLPSIYDEIDAKEAEWEALEPKTRTISDPFMGEPQVVPIDKSEVVRPEIPDYYAKRRAEYPPLAEQLDAFWKGPESEAYQLMVAKIAEIKSKYPKP